MALPYNFRFYDKSNLIAKNCQKTDRNVHSQKGDKNKRGKKEKKPKMDITGQEVQDDEGLFQVIYDCFCFTHKNLRRFVTVAQNAICRILTNTGKKLWVSVVPLVCQ